MLIPQKTASKLWTVIEIAGNSAVIQQGNQSRIIANDDYAEGQTIIFDGSTAQKTAEKTEITYI